MNFEVSKLIEMLHRLTTDFELVSSHNSIIQNSKDKLFLNSRGLQSKVPTGI